MTLDTDAIMWLIIGLLIGFCIGAIIVMLVRDLIDAELYSKELRAGG